MRKDCYLCHPVQCLASHAVVFFFLGGGGGGRGGGNTSPLKTTAWEAIQCLMHAFARTPFKLSNLPYGQQVLHNRSMLTHFFALFSLFLSPSIDSSYINPILIFM